MIRKLATLTLLAAAAVAAAPIPALADGPKTPQEAAVCQNLLDEWAHPLGFTPTSVNSVCTVRGNAS
ncbi:hypothetical protein ACIGXM_19040 [Kitasatospora sp. NPDC052896]|uniref:hypothetical protein n=1 Tax=Kitasatospora sp. NPDC052896 TaxID=3364061 RepID=UPI0037C79418